MKRLLNILIAASLLCLLAPARAEGRLAADIAWLDRITYGAQPANLALLQTFGREGFLDQQLTASGNALPGNVSEMIGKISPAELPMMDALRLQASETEAAKMTQDADKINATRQAINKMRQQHARAALQRMLIRAIYSPHQLEEQLLWFWTNHFSIFQRKGNIALMLDDYQRTLRPHVLGNFRQLLTAASTHPAMLVYLDNASNRKGKINENFARELMELHTLGVDGGYGQKDVEELARILTGLGVTPLNRLEKTETRPPDGLHRSGLFQFDPRRHDFGDKTLLGIAVPGQGWQEVEQALDILATHPATARHIAHKLAQYFVADDPPASVVESCAQVFLNTKGDLRATTMHLLKSPEFSASANRKLKSSWQYVISVARVTHPENPPARLTNLTEALDILGQLPFHRITPDGYPMTADAWSSPAQLAQRFEFAKLMVSAGLRERQLAFSELFSSPEQNHEKRKASPGAAALHYLSGPQFMYR